MTGMKTIRKMPEFSILLKRNQDEIITEWVNQVLSIPDSHYQQYPPQKVDQWMSQGLDVIIQAFAAGSPGVLDAYIHEIASTHLDQDFPIYMVTESFLLVGEIITPLILQALPASKPEAIETISQLNACIRYMIRCFERSFSESIHQQLVENAKQKLQESESIQKTMMALLQKLNQQEVLEIVCLEACQLIHASGSAILILTDEWLQVACSTGNPSLIVERLPVADSLSGLAVLQKRPWLDNNPQCQSKIKCWHPDVQSLLVTPLWVEEKITGVINVINKPGGFNQDDLRIMNLFAEQAAIAIENARLQQESEQLATVNERQRLARDLHDSVTQTIYSLSLYADATQRSLRRNKTQKAMAHLQELRKMIHEIMVDMRLLIFELHPPVLQKDGLATALQTRLESVEARSDIQTANQGEPSLTPRITRKVLREISQPCTKPISPDTLTEREIEVLKLVAKGLDNPRIAKRLSVAEVTIRTHVAHISDKLHLANRVRAALFALHENMVTLEDGMAEISAGDPT